MEDERPNARRLLLAGLDVRERPCTVVGGGAVGGRKARTLARAGARVTVVAPEIADETRSLVDEGRAVWLQETFHDHHLEGAFLVVAATDDKALNERIGRAARARELLVCVASSAGLSNVAFPALHELDGFTVAVSTHGRDPAGAVRLRDRIAELLRNE